MGKVSEIAGYLFVTFTGESEDGEQIYLALSEDGFHWQELNGGRPVLRSRIGEKGVRDPFLLRSRDKSRYYLMATDLRMASGRSWEDAQLHGSRSVIVWESEDLVCWSEPRSCEVGTEESGCVWAPEAVYAPEKEAYMVFWSSYSEGKYRIWRAYTRDFRVFEDRGIYMEQAYDVIDMTIIRDSGTYYRFYKNEQEKYLCMDCGKDLEGTFIPVESFDLRNRRGVEGPVLFPAKDGKWCLLVDQFAANGGYVPLICESLSEGRFRDVKKENYDMGRQQKRHGSVLLLSGEEYDRVKGIYGRQAK
ncbi:MAG TPA: 1,4-beta-xylanase [Lachnospiraceae bacterium]|nr:1,4-beta-xylanase [Lachnospiraceae bacterium]